MPLLCYLWGLNLGPMQASDWEEKREEGGGRSRGEREGVKHRNRKKLHFYDLPTLWFWIWTCNWLNSFDFSLRNGSSSNSPPNPLLKTDNINSFIWLRLFVWDRKANAAEAQITTALQPSSHTGMTARLCMTLCYFSTFCKHKQNHLL